MRNIVVSILIVLVFLLGLVKDLYASYALFDEPTDTINVAGQTVIGNAFTFEAVILFTKEFNGGGKIFNEWTSGQEDKLLWASPNSLAGYAYPTALSYTVISADCALTTGVPHHIAYVHDATQERLYLDGSLLKSRVVRGDVGDGTGNPHIGAIFRDGGIRSSFIGYVDSLRISDTARYNSTEFIPVLGDFVSDEHTLLLYDFNEAPGSLNVIDKSGNGHDGTLGIGFDGATKPSFENPVPIPGTFSLLIFGLLGLFGLKKKVKLFKNS